MEDLENLVQLEDGKYYKGLLYHCQNSNNNNDGSYGGVVAEFKKDILVRTDEYKIYNGNSKTQ